MKTFIKTLALGIAFMIMTSLLSCEKEPTCKTCYHVYETIIIITHTGQPIQTITNKGNIFNACDIDIEILTHSIDTTTERLSDLTYITTKKTICE